MGIVWGLARVKLPWVGFVMQVSVEVSVYCSKRKPKDYGLRQQRELSTPSHLNAGREK